MSGGLYIFHFPYDEKGMIQLAPGEIIHKDGLWDMMAKATPINLFASGQARSAKVTGVRDYPYFQRVSVDFEEIGHPTVPPPPMLDRP